MTAPATIDAHIQAVAAIRTRLQAFLAHAWDGLPHYNEAQVEPFLRLAVPLVLAAQKHTAVLTDAYLARLLSTFSGSPVRPVGLDTAALVGAGVRAGAAPAEVYRRAFVTVWSGLKAGDQWPDAVAAGRARVLSTASMDVALTQRATMAQVSEQSDRIVGYRRVLTSGNACDLCTAASDQFYHSGDLMPIHNNCDCDVVPVTSSHDPAHDQSVLKHSQFRITDPHAPSRGSKYEYAVRQHGELGPVLTPAGDHFTGPSEVAA